MASYQAILGHFKTPTVLPITDEVVSKPGHAPDLSGITSVGVQGRRMPRRGKLHVAMPVACFVLIRKNALQVKRVRCEASGVLVAKDKAIKRFIVRNIVDASAIRDIQDSSILEGRLPLTACALHGI